MRPWPYFSDLFLKFLAVGVELGQMTYPNDSNISRANYFFLRPLARELFEILKCANLIEGANYSQIFLGMLRELFETR